MAKLTLKYNNLAALWFHRCLVCNTQMTAPRRTGMVSAKTM
jgi:hypothetical protein